MATITPTVTNSEKGVLVTWTGVSTADTMTAYQVDGGAHRGAFLMMEGTWGSSTVVLKGSNDGSVYLGFKDMTGTTISATADTAFNVRTAAKYLNPASSGGTNDNVNVTLFIPR